MLRGALFLFFLSILLTFLNSRHLVVLPPPPPFGKMRRQRPKRIYGQLFRFFFFFFFNSGTVWSGPKVVVSSQTWAALRFRPIEQQLFQFSFLHSWNVGTVEQYIRRTPPSPLAVATGDQPENPAILCCLEPVSLSFPLSLSPSWKK